MVPSEVVDVLDKVGIPKQYQSCDYTLDQLIEQLESPYSDNVREFLRRESLGLYLYGSNGSGKTTLSCEILKHAITEKVQCFRGDVHHFLSSFKENEWAISPKYIQPRLIVIDELGKSLNSKYDLLTPNLERLLQYRLSNNKAVILCSNIGLDQVGKLYGPTIYSLIRGYLKPVKFPKVDHRA